MIPHALSGLEFVERFYTFPSRTSINEFACSLKKYPGSNKMIIVQSDNHPYGFSEQMAEISGILAAGIIINSTHTAPFFHIRALSIAIISSIQMLLQVPAPLKVVWPDKIFWNKKEICVISSVTHETNPDISVSGFCLLVNTTAEDFSGTLSQMRTSLRNETSKQYPISRILYNITDSYHTLINQPEDPLHQQYNSLLYGISEQIEINGFRGILDTVEKDGNLRVLNHSCTEHFVHGEIRFQR